MTTSPSITAFIPVFNAEKYVIDAIKSILCQTHQDFELLILDDASTDHSSQLIEQFLQQHPDSRVHYHRFDENQGVSALGNHAIDMAKGRYLFRLDADDIALPNRMQLQYDYIKRRPDTVAISSAIISFGEHEPDTQIAATQFDAELKALFFWARGNILNPASMFDLTFVKKHHIRYDVEMRVAEDLNFWVDIALKGGGFHNLTQPLTKYRSHAQQVSHQRNTGLANNLHKIRSKLIPVFFPKLSTDDQLFITEFLSHSLLREVFTQSEMKKAVDIMTKMLTMKAPSKLRENRKLLLSYVQDRLSFWQQQITV